MTQPVPGPTPSVNALAEARARAAASHPVRVIVLGEPHRGDDGVAFVAVRLAVEGLSPAVRERVEVRETGQLDPADLVELAATGGAIVVDAVVGVPPGEIVVLPLDVVAAGASGGVGEPGAAGVSDAVCPPRAGPLVPRSSHVLPVDQLVALASALRGSPPRGVLVGLGGERFGVGEGLSSAVATAVPSFAAAIGAEVERLVNEAGEAPSDPG